VGLGQIKQSRDEFLAEGFITCQREEFFELVDHNQVVGRL